MSLATITQGDIPIVCERLRALIGASDADLVICEVSRLQADLVALEALARLRLTARRLGCGLRLRGSSRALEQLLAFCGLCDVLPLDGELGGIRWHERQPEEREPACGVEEGVETRDPPV